MIELKERAPWVCRTWTTSNEPTDIDLFYDAHENADRFWSLGEDVPKMAVTVP